MTVFYIVVVSASTLIALTLALLFGQLNMAIAVIALTTGTGIALWARKQFVEDCKMGPTRNWELPIKLVVGILIVFQFVYLIYMVDGKVYVGNPNNLGDLPFHINMIKSFAKGISFWPENLEWAGARLRYPFGVDVFSALFETLGLRTNAHLALLGIFASFVLFQELRKWAGIFMIVAFFWSGGFESWTGFLNGNGAWPGSQVDFKNLFLAVFVTQRGFLWALPAGIFFIRQLQKNQKLNMGQEVILGFILGVSPLLHLHSAFFLYLFLAISIWFQGERRQWFRILAGSTILSVPLLVTFLFGGTGQLEHSVGWLSLWTYTPQYEKGIWHYLVANFFPLLVIIPVLGWNLYRQRRWEGFIGIGLFILFCSVKLAPWPWDNIKVLIWAYLLICFEFYRWVLKGKSSWIQIACCILFAPGFFQLLAGAPSKGIAARVSSSAYLVECEDAAYSINESVVSSPDFDHPLLFTGVKMVFGYEGHLWAHGYDVEKRKALVKKLMQGDSDWQEAAKELGAKWAYWGQNEKSFFRAEPIWMKSLKSRPACNSRPFRGDRIYDLTSIQPPVEPSVGP